MCRDLKIFGSTRHRMEDNFLPSPSSLFFLYHFSLFYNILSVFEKNSRFRDLKGIGTPGVARKCSSLISDYIYLFFLIMHLSIFSQ